MDPLIYKVLHLAGVVGLFTALGSLIATDENGSSKLGSILHGISLILILVSGFGMVAKFGYGFPGWVIAKLVIWFGLGAMLAVAKRKALPQGATFAVVLILGILAAWLGIYKPF
jgi:hypothetical protein